MKRIGLIGKTKDERALFAIDELRRWLKERGVAALVEREAADLLQIEGFNRSEIVGTADIIVVIGGDGTMLSVSRAAAVKGTPIVGINLGGLGFITEINKEDIFETMTAALSEDCALEERIMLVARVYRDGAAIAAFDALNDVVISKSALARIFDMETYIGGTYVTTYKADGLIISTPTGSTAYNLSAGGPIVYPTLNCIVITPICPHTITNRPIVIEDGMKITLKIRSREAGVYLSMDGQEGVQLNPEDEIEVSKSDYKTRLLIPHNRDYFKILREKLNWGMR